MKHGDRSEDGKRAGGCSNRRLPTAATWYKVMDVKDCSD
jgi:hypothetical protein